MDIKEVIKNRHSVRRFKPKQIEEEIKEQLDACAERINQDSGLHIQVIYDEPDCFNSFLAHYGKFQGVMNYIALVGKKNDTKLEEKCGYYGEKLLLTAEGLGLNSCWVGGTYGKRKCSANIGPDEKLVCVIALGYGEYEGYKHKSKEVSKLCNVDVGEMPVWFQNGVKAAMMAPTALNQQKFFIEAREDGTVRITAKKGFFTKVDLGIVKYHFEVVSGHKVK